MADFNGDRTPDYYVDERRARCSQPFSANGRTFNVSVFVTGSGDALELLKATALDSRIDRSAGALAVVLELKGDGCGYAPREQHCRYRMVWSQPDQKFLTSERAFVGDDGRLSATPSWPALSAELPTKFGDGAFSFPKKAPRKGCATFYAADNRTRMFTSFSQDDWNALAVRVTALGCDTDMAWYFLAVAAENLGRPNAARTYYAMAIKRFQSLSIRSYSSCNLPSLGKCWGLNIVSESETGIARLQDVTH